MRACERFHSDWPLLGNLLLRLWLRAFERRAALEEHFKNEAKTLSSLTGRAVPDILKRMTANGQLIWSR